MPKYNMTLMGANFRPAEAREIVKSLAISDGELFTLEPEPNNQYDMFAVKVLYADEHVGYLPKGPNEVIFDRLIDGEVPSSIEIVAFESTLKPVLEISFDD